MSRLDSSVQKTTKNILHALNESAFAKSVKEASAASTQQQINRDKPEEAPKENKEALIKKNQSAKIPAKSLKETYNQITKDALYSMISEADLDKLVNEFNEKAIKDAERVSSEEGVENTPETIEFNPNEYYIINGYYNTVNEFCDFVKTKTNGEVDLYDYINDTSLIESSLKEDLDAIHNQIADLQEYLNNTPEIADDEREAIQAEIDELLDEVNYNEVEMTESSLTEAPNPENADINKKIMSTIRTKADQEPKHKSDLEAAGLKLEPNRYYNSWDVFGPNGRRVSKNDFMGGRNAEFNSENKKVADYYGRLTKEDPNYKDKQSWTNMKNEPYKRTQKLDKFHHRNKETGEWEPGIDYTVDYYDKRQRDSQGYDFNDLNNGNKNINDYKSAAETARTYEVGGNINRLNQGDVDKAQADYDTFMATIGSQIENLKKKIDERKKWRDSNIRTGENAEKERQAILNNARAKRNRGGNV